MTEREGDLGFDFEIRKSGELDISHKGRKVTSFNAARGVSIWNKLVARHFVDQQILMARLTGNYKRGNERQAKHKNLKHS